MQTQRSLTLLAAFALAALLSIALHAPCAAAETLTPDGLLSKLDKRERVTLTKADGTTEEITVEEMDRLAKRQHAQQVKLQREKTAEGAAVADDDDEEASENAPKRLTESFEEIQKKNPSFAVNIELSRSAFGEIQRHGYARGYAYSGFSEKDVPAPRGTDKKSKTKSKGKDGKKKAKATPREDYKVTLLLRAKRDPSDRKARTGTSAQKRTKEPLTVSYEVQVLLDAQEQFFLLAAWELDAEDKRETRLSIKPSEALLKKQQEAKAAARKFFFQDLDVSTWILAGGVALILAGVVVLYTTQKPSPVARKRRNSADNWELAKDTKKNK